MGYIAAQALQSQPIKLHYAFQKDPDPVTIHPYYLSGTMTTATDAAGLRYETVTFHIPPPAAGSIVSIYGTHLDVGTAQVVVSVTDSKGTARSAPIFYSSPTQVNLEIPSGTQTGTATVSGTAQDGTSVKTQIAIAGVSPDVFQLSSNTALVAAYVVRVRADATQSFEPAYPIDAANNVVPLPIDLSFGDVYLSLFCTGIRNAKTVSALLAGRLPTCEHRTRRRRADGQPRRTGNQVIRRRRATTRHRAPNGYGMRPRSFASIRITLVISGI